MKKINVLGAGISGLAAAINLAKAGYEVAVYEKNKDVGTRFRGDLQGLENWSEKQDIVAQLKEMNVSINFDCDSFTEVTVADCGHENTVSWGKPLFYLVKRGSFEGSLDWGLKQQAQDAGVDILFNRTIPPEEADIIATGPIFKEIAGVDKGVIFKTKSENKAVLALSDDLAFKGYSYLLVVNGYGCMCAVAANEPNKISGCFERTKKFFCGKYRFGMEVVKPVGGVGSFSLRHALKIRRRKKETLYVGEAAGLQDLLWGFGMRYAFESGYLAAKSIIDNQDYEQLAKKKFENRLKAAVVNRYLWESLGSKAYSFITNHPTLAVKCLYSIHNYNLIQRALYPFAVSYIRKKYPNLKI